MTPPVRLGILRDSTEIYAGMIRNEEEYGYGVATCETYELAGNNTESGWVGRAKFSDRTGWGNCANEKGLIVFEYKNGARYEGEHKLFDPHGKGVLKYASGNIYIGNFIEGERSGYGIFEMPGIGVYKGLWKNDKIAVKPDSPLNFYHLIPHIGPKKKEASPIATTDLFNIEDWKLIGELKDGIPNGKAEFTFGSGDSFSGEFNAGMPVKGKAFWKNYGEYEGIFK